MSHESSTGRLPPPFGFFRAFARREASGSLLLLLATIAAFAWANSPWWESYDRLWGIEVGIGPEGRRLSLSILHLINDGLMAIFFFVVGLEIKRELVAGELASPRRAALPMVAAVGGMLVPAAIFVAFNAGGAASAGWGIPMATDIAFALAVMSSLGSRMPGALKIFLTALAIVDDLGAILVIAVFYSHGAAWGWLGGAAVFLMVLAVFNALQVQSPTFYVLPGLVVWVTFLYSGIHPTVAGVLVAMTIPARLTTSAQEEAIHDLEQATEQVLAPLTRFEQGLHPWVTYAILPLFALANAGVRVIGGEATVWAGSLTLGIVLGLVIGKQVGITLFAWVAVRLRLAELPRDVDWREVWGTAWLGGIGFTMSLFIANLAFPEASLLASSKLAILAGSVLSALGGWLILTRVAGTRAHPS